MARPGITYDDVARTAYRMLAEGVSPSVTKIRERLGTGSAGTISKHLKTWQQQRGETSVVRVPSSVPEALLAPVEEIWRQAKSLAESQLSEERLVLEDDREAVEADQARVQGLLEERDRRLAALEAAAKQSAAELHSAKAALEAEKTLHATSVSELKLVTSKLQTEKQQSIALAGQLAKSEELHEASLARTREEAAEHLARIETHAADTEQHWIQRIAQVQEALGRASEQADQARRETASVRQEMHDQALAFQEERSKLLLEISHLASAGDKREALHEMALARVREQVDQLKAR